MSTEHQTIVSAFHGAQALRPYKMDAAILKSITPPGGEWAVVAKQGAITRSVVWRGIEVALVNPEGALDDGVEGDIAMGLRATPILDTALRTILKLAKDGADRSLIAKIAETAIACVELPAPRFPKPSDDDDAPTDEDDGEPL